MLLHAQLQWIKKKKKKVSTYSKGLTPLLKQGTFILTNRSQPWPICTKENITKQTIFLNLLIPCHKGPVWNHVLITLESGCGAAHATAITKLQIINLFCANLADALFQDAIACGQEEKTAKIQLFPVLQNSLRIHLQVYMEATFSHIM